MFANSVFDDVPDGRLKLNNAALRSFEYRLCGGVTMRLAMVSCLVVGICVNKL